MTKAAQKLYISLPSLSAMVKKAEAELGITIFDRTASPLKLTEEGNAYIEFIRQCIENEASLDEKLSDIRNLSKGQTRVGGSNYVLSSIIPEILKHILFRYPGIEIELTEEGSFALQKHLLPYHKPSFRFLRPWEVLHWVWRSKEWIQPLS